MTILLRGYSYMCELERLSRLFFPDEQIRTITGEDTRDCLHADIAVDESGAAAVLTDGSDEFTHSIAFTEAELGDDVLKELAIARALYIPLCSMTGYTPPWGMLTGVRPVKLMRMLAEKSGAESAKKAFAEVYGCSDSKIKLCEDTMRGEQPILKASRPESFSLYISIPFCTTRCSYCSFVSQSVEKAAYLIDDYVEALIREIEATARTASELGLRLETVYMGGGTPTTLEPHQLARILGAVNSRFDMSGVREFTVEAGRPDTVTREKLEEIKKAGVQRISINPQTLDDNVLHAIGRRHTVAQVYDAMDIARSVGFKAINMDLIAGLTNDTPEGFSKTLDGIFSLAPENITVHTLSMKRASNLVIGGEKVTSDRLTAEKMLSECAARLPAEGYHPYYLYRQTRMLGNLENVGWSTEGCDGLYNVYIMDETHTILAVGAGAVSKLRQPGVNNIERIYNFKFPYEYLSRFDTMLERKRGVIDFYEKFR